MNLNDHAPFPIYLPNQNRYDSMSYKRCGKSGLILPMISLGMWHNFGDYDSLANARKLLRGAFDSGITSFDLANNYGPPYGSAERNFGKLLELDFKAHRDELIIATKAGYDMWEGPYGRGGSKKYLAASIDQSLKRLNLDYVDIFYHHKPDPDTPLEETAHALDLLVKQGKALYIGLSRYNHEEASKIMEIFKALGTPCIVNQSKYSLLEQSVEQDFLIHSDELKLGFVAFSPLAQGVLSNKYFSSIPENSRANNQASYLQLSSQYPLDRINLLNQIANKRGQTISQLALSWLMSKESVTSVLIGCSSVEQLKENISALDNIQYSDNELSQINFVLTGEQSEC